MSQPQSQAPPRNFSPAAQMSPSPVGHAASFSGQPPSKKPRLSPAPSAQGLAQPGGNATYSSFARNNGINGTASPGTPGTPNSITSPPPPSQSPAVPSPFPMPSPIAPSASPSPVMAPAGAHPSNGARSNSNGSGYNGMPTPKLQPRPNAPNPTMQSPGLQTPTSGPPTMPQLAPTPTMTAAQTSNVFVPIVPTGMQTPSGGGSVMGPPSKPAERSTKEYQYDVDDSLAGTGIDLRQEEQFQADYFAGTYRPEARTGFPANTPGGRDSFYGALSANQPPELLGEVDQKRAMVEEAKRQWTESAQNLARMRGNALHNRFLEFGALHMRAEKIAKEHGVGILLDPKPSAAASTSFRMRPDTEFPKPQLTVTTKTGPDGVAMISTTGYFLPEDTYLADQLALLSLATKHRLRELLEDANKVAVTRQTTSHGVVPEEWLDAATPLPPTSNEEGQGDHGTMSLKRSRDTSDAAAATAAADEAASTPEDVAKKIAASNMLVQSLRVAGRTERTMEEQRLLKRQKREAKKAGDLGAPATPGSPAIGGAGSGSAGGSAGDAGDVVKPPTKKELKRSVAAKMAEQNETLSANQTSMAFLGGRKKQYSWLSGGSSAPRRSFGQSSGRGSIGAGGGGGDAAGGGSGTPGASGAGGAGGSGGAAGGAAGGTARRNGGGGSGMLTGDGRTKWGAWREDGIKGKDIQLRDLVVVLEADGREVVALQNAYTKLDGMSVDRPARPGP